MTDLPTALRQSITALPYPPPTTPFLLALISARTPPPPFPALAATARTRLLAADLTSSAVVDTTSPAALALAFPANLSKSLTTKAQLLPHDVVAQVLDVENLSRSRWEQVEELEALERGEGTQGREIVRLPPTPDGDADEGVGDVAPEQRPQPARGAAGAATGAARGAAVATAGRNATHKLTLQDCRGQRVFGLELKRVERIGIGRLNIGEKVVLKAGAKVARGTVLLEPDTCRFLGGKVEAWHTQWVDGRLARLREAVGVPRNGTRG